MLVFRKCYTESTMSITNPTSCEVGSVVRFLNAKMFIQLTFINSLWKCMEKVLFFKDRRKWCKLCNEGSTNVHDVP